MRRSAKNWKTFAAFPKCQLCGHWERVEFRYFTSDLAAVIMFCGKAGWEYDDGRWYCPDHRRNDVAP